MDPAVFFYTSCVWADGWRALTRFHTDLEYQLRIQEGFGVSGVIGAVAEPESAREGDVTRAGVMLALYSPKYFRSPGAGFEWSVFRSRVRHHEQTLGVSAAGCLIPLCWKPMRDEPVPDAVRASVEAPGAFDWLRHLGVEYLAASQETEDRVRYYALVEQLAKSIAEAGRTELEPLSAADARELDPAFGNVSSIQWRREAGRDDERPQTWPGLAHTGALERRSESVAISYVGADQPWADWMTDVLERRGHAVVQRRWRVGRGESLRDAVAHARAAAERLLVIFSRNYFAARDTSPTEWEDAFGASPGRASHAVLVQIDAAPRPLLVRDVKVVALAGADPAQAEQLIDEVLPEASQPSEGRGGGR